MTPSAERAMFTVSSKGSTMTATNGSDAMQPTGARARPRALRRRGRGQAAVLDYGLALILSVGTILVWSSIRSRQATLQRSIAIAEETTYIADAATKYVVQNYTALEQWLSVPGIEQTVEFTPSCVGGGACQMPAVGSPIGAGFGQAGWKSLADATLLPPEQVNINQAGQPYRIVVHCATVTNGSCTQLSAILATYGGPTVSDSVNAQVANTVGMRAGFIPNNPGILGYYETAGWLTNWAMWSVGGTPRTTPGHIAVTLDLDIGRDIGSGQIHRYGSGDDTRAQTMGRTLYMAKSSVNQTPANVCFCGNDGYFHGQCVAPNGVGVPDTPASPNFCGTQP